MILKRFVVIVDDFRKVYNRYSRAKLHRKQCGRVNFGVYSIAYRMLIQPNLTPPFLSADLSRFFLTFLVKETQRSVEQEKKERNSILKLMNYWSFKCYKFHQNDSDLSLARASLSGFAVPYYFPD